MFKEITKMAVALIIIAGAIVSLFVDVNTVGEELIRLLAVGIFGFYFAGTDLPIKLGLTSRKK
uniref:Uncharacterized protein n=1 Tax=viral metagenome TaxID=1070528 RepID=A0A6M3LA68_9ZZZZ